MSRSAADSRRRPWRRSGPVLGLLLALLGQPLAARSDRVRRGDRQFRTDRRHAALPASAAGVLAAVGEQLSTRTIPRRPKRPCAPSPAMPVRSVWSGWSTTPSGLRRSACSPLAKASSSARRGRLTRRRRWIRGGPRSPSPAPAWRRQRGAYLEAISATGSGLVRLVRSTERTVFLANLVFWMLAVLLLAAALFVLVEVATKGSAVIADLRQALERKMPPVSATLCVALAPALAARAAFGPGLDPALLVGAALGLREPQRARRDRRRLAARRRRAVDRRRRAAARRDRALAADARSGESLGRPALRRAVRRSAGSQGGYRRRSCGRWSSSRMSTGRSGSGTRPG